MTTATTRSPSERLASGYPGCARTGELVDPPAGTVATTGASRMSPRRRTLGTASGASPRESLLWLEHVRSAGTVPGARRVVPAPHPEHSLHDFPLRPLELVSAAPYGISVDESGEVLDEVALTRALDGHRVALTPAEEAELQRRMLRWMMAAGWTDEEAAARLGVSKRTVLRRRREAGIPSSRPRPPAECLTGRSA